MWVGDVGLGLDKYVDGGQPSFVFGRICGYHRCRVVRGDAASLFDGVHGNVQKIVEMRLLPCCFALALNGTC